MNNDNFLIEEADLELARDICKFIENSELRNRAVANALAADISKKYFTEVEVDTDSGLHSIAKVLEDIDIADVYIRNAYVDVRVYFNENELCVPKSHFDRNLLPSAYMFIKLDSELSGGLVTGFMLPSAVDVSKDFSGYYKLKEDDLISFYDVEGHLNGSYEDNIPDEFESKIFAYLDDTLEDVNAFYRVLFDSKEARRLLKEAANVQNIFNFISVPDADSLPCKENTSDNLLEDNFEESGTFDLLEEDDSSSDLLDSSEELVSFEEADDDIDEVAEFDMLEENNSSEMLEEFAADTLDAADNEEDGFDLTSDDTVSEDISFVQEPLEQEEASVEILSMDAEESVSMDSISFPDFTEDVTDNIEEVNALEDSVQEPDEVSLQENNEIIQYEVLPDIQDENEEPEVEIKDYMSDETLNFAEDSDVDQNQFAENIEQNIDEAGVQGNQEFSTNVTPSSDNVSGQSQDDELESLLNNDKSVFDETDPAVVHDNDSQIQDLFGEDPVAQESIDENFTAPVKAKKSGFIPILGFLTIVAALGYFGYTKFYNQSTSSDETLNISGSAQLVPSKDSSSVPVQDAMPIETVENVEPVQHNNEGNAISIPAIEQNLDASILVSNLSINWEVPAGYISNSTAQRYFRKMGKIIQLNLKTEMLLLSKPPITNKIMLELEFNKNKNKFDVKGITASSGEKVVDDLIVKTVNNALNISLKTNMSTFSNIPGNPVLIIRL